MPERPTFTRARGTSIDIGDDRIATLTYTSGRDKFQRVTTLTDLIAEWRMVGRAIADWEDRHDVKVRTFPDRPRPRAVKGGDEGHQAAASSNSNAGKS